MADNNETFGVKDVKPVAGGTNIRDLIRFTTGGSNNRNDLESALRGKGYRERDVRRMGRAFTKIQNSPDRDFILHGDDSFSVTEGGQALGGSGRKKGNVQGFDVGDVIGLGNDISRLAGAMQDNIPLLEQKREDDKALAARIVENDQAIEDRKFDLLTPDGFDLNPDFIGGDPINTTAKTRTRAKSPTVAETIRGDVLDPIVRPKLPVPEVGPFPEGVEAKASIGAEDPGLLAQIATGRAAELGNSSIVTGALDVIKDVYPKAFGEDGDFGAFFDFKGNANTFMEGFNRQQEANELNLQNKIQTALANGENFVSHQGAGIGFDNEGNITRRVMNGGDNPAFNLGILTPTGGIIGKGVDKVNKLGDPIRRLGQNVATRFSNLFKGSAPVSRNINDYFRAVANIQRNPNLSRTAKETAMRETSSLYKDVLQAYSKSREIIPKTGTKALEKITGTGKEILRKDAQGVADNALIRKQAQDVADKAIRRQKVLGKTDEATRSAVPTNTIGSQFSSSSPLTKFTAEIKALEKIGRKRGMLSDGTRVRLKGKVWEIFRHGGKTKFSR